MTLAPRLAATFASLALAAAALTGCGGEDEQRQDAGEPAETFQVKVVRAEFPAKQRLAQTSEMILEIQNTGAETVPELAVTITVGDGGDGAFYVREEAAGLASPDRPVWVLENGYPKLLGHDEPSGAAVAQTNTFAFGALDPGETREIVWRVSAVRGGDYTVNYTIAAGLHGKAKAVGESGEPVRGSLEASVSTESPEARVNDRGEVELREPSSR